MAGKCLRQRNNACTRPQPDLRPWPGAAGQRGQLPVEFGKAFRRNHAVAACHRLERRVEPQRLIEQRGDAAETDDVDPHAKRGQELPALQRLGLLRQHGKAAIDAALPIMFRSPDRTLCQTTQFPQRERQEPAGSQRRRQWRQQTECKRGGAYPNDDSR